MVNLVQHLRILYLTVFLVWAWIVCHKRQPSTFCRPQTISDLFQPSELVERLRTQHLFEAGCIRSHKWASTSELSEVHSLGSSLQSCSASTWYEMLVVSRRGSGFSKTFGIFLAVHSGEEGLRAFMCFFAWFHYSSGTFCVQLYWFLLASCFLWGSESWVELLEPQLGPDRRARLQWVDGQKSTWKSRPGGQAARQAFFVEMFWRCLRCARWVGVLFLIPSLGTGFYKSRRGCRATSESSPFPTCCQSGRDTGILIVLCYSDGLFSKEMGECLVIACAWSESDSTVCMARAWTVDQFPARWHGLLSVQCSV